LINGATALEKLHALGMIHRDVKGANFLIGDDGKFKICSLLNYF
jgi:serine/threonine protein kinase